MNAMTALSIGAHCSVGVGRRYSSSRERRRDLDHEEDEASQPTSSEQERDFMEHAEVGTKVSHPHTDPKVVVRNC